MKQKRTIDMLGKVFGRLTVIQGIRSSGGSTVRANQAQKNLKT